MKRGAIKAGRQVAQADGPPRDGRGLPPAPSPEAALGARLVRLAPEPPRRGALVPSAVRPLEPPVDRAARMPKGLEVDVDGRCLTISASEQVVLRCGQASITLDASGRVAIRGTKVVSRASGANKIRGGTVHIN